MRRFEDSTFLFISTNIEQPCEGVEAHWLPVMKTLAEKGSTVRFLCVMGCPLEGEARDAGISVDPYILDKWNVIRSHSRLRKYLRRYDPVCAHSTGLEADLLLRWSARKVPGVRIAHTIAGAYQATRRKRPVNALMRRFDELGMRSADAVFVGDEDDAKEVRSMGVSAERVILDDSTQWSAPASVRLHMDIYRGFMAERGA